MNTQERKKRKTYRMRLREVSFRIIEAIYEYIPYNYVRDVIKVLEREGYENIGMPGLNRRIHQVRKGVIGDLKIAKAIKEVALNEKKKLDEIDVMLEDLENEELKVDFKKGL